MATRQYIGARYVPKYEGTWNKERNYEALSIVEKDGTSYTSKIPVPSGIDISNEKYWVISGIFNGQLANLIEKLRDKVDKKSEIIFVDDLGINDNNPNNANILNEFLDTVNDGCTLLFGSKTYNFNGSIILPPKVNILGRGDSRINFTGSDYNCITIKSQATDSDYAYNYSKIMIENILITGNTSLNGIFLGVSDFSETTNFNCALLKNVRCENLNIGIMIDGYGHLLENCFCANCNTGIFLKDAEQCSLIGCWCTDGVNGVTNHLSGKSPAKYFSTLNIIGGSYQRNSGVSIDLQNGRCVTIQTYFELNKNEDIILGYGVGYDYSVNQVNIFSHTECSTRNPDKYSISCIGLNGGTFNILSTNPEDKLVFADGYSKNITVYTNETTASSAYHFDDVSSKTCVINRGYIEMCGVDNSIIKGPFYEFKAKNVLGTKELAIYGNDGDVTAYIARNFNIKSISQPDTDALAYFSAGRLTLNTPMTINHPNGITMNNGESQYCLLTNSESRLSQLSIYYQDILLFKQLFNECVINTPLVVNKKVGDNYVLAIGENDKEIIKLDSQLTIKDVFTIIKGASNGSILELKDNSDNTVADVNTDYFTIHNTLKINNISIRENNGNLEAYFNEGWHKFSFTD